MIKGFKIKLYPTKQQEELMWKHVHCCRFIYNYMVDLQQKRYEAHETCLSHFSMCNLLAPLKNDGEHAWLCEVAHASLNRVCRDVDIAFKFYFHYGSNPPKFKSKKTGKRNFPISNKVWFGEDGRVRVQKIGAIKFKTDLCVPCGRNQKFWNPRIVNENGKWLLTFEMQCENQAFVLNDYKMGIDLGVKDAAIVACGDQKIVFHNINKSSKIKILQQRIKHKHRSLSRKARINKRNGMCGQSKNSQKEQEKLRKLYARVTNIRNNFIHQSTKSLINLLPQRVVMETLNVKGLMHNRHMAKAIQDQSFYEWCRQMSYKCQWHGIEFVQVPMFYPSSKTCHNCGCVKTNLHLKDRVFVCQECGYKEDRDYNAALNLMSYGD